MTLSALLTATIERKASDLHLTVGAPPTLRVERELLPLADYQSLVEDDTKQFAKEMLSAEQWDALLSQRELDFSYDFAGRGRFRVNAFFQRGALSLAMRLIPARIPSFEELSLPQKILSDFCNLSQGLVLVTGSAGQGKSTTIASMIGKINAERATRIITIEDPIEYLFQHDKSLVDQREMHADTHSWAVALRSALREDPDILVVGEMRDYETIASTITAAETGHLVLATLHTNSAGQTVERIIDVFPAEQQQQVRTQLAFILKGVVCQKLLPRAGGGVVPAVEVLLNSPAVQNVIREGKTQQLRNIINTSLESGMVSFEHSLATLIKNGVVSREVALAHSEHPSEVTRLLG